MAQINSAITKKVYQLARISKAPTDDIVDTKTQELSSILEYADQISEVDTTGFDSLQGSRIITVNELREDVPYNSEAQKAQYQKVRQAIIANFPNSKSNLLVVDGIFAGD